MSDYYDPTMEWPRSVRQLAIYTAFYGVFLAMGVFITGFSLWYFLWDPVRVNMLFLETRGAIIGQRVVQEEWGPSHQVQVRYRAGEQELENWAPGDFGRFKVGDERPVWYDPANHNRVVVERGYNVLWWLFCLMFALGLLMTSFAGRTILRGVSKWRTA